MKKVLIILNILLLGIIIFQACKLKKTSITDKSLSGTETSASRDCRVDDCGRVICKDYSDVPLDGEVDAETLIKMSSDYSKDNAKSTIAGMTEPDGSAKQDALSVYFRLDQLKNFIWRMEQAACKSACSDSTDLAVRVYFIKYPDKLGTAEVADCLRTLPAEYSSKHSIALVPAYKRAGEYYDFVFGPLEPGCFSRPIDVNNAGAIKKAAIISMPGSGDNHGGIGPPPGVGTYPTNPE